MARGRVFVFYHSRPVRAAAGWVLISEYLLVFLPIFLDNFLPVALYPRCFLKILINPSSQFYPVHAFRGDLDVQLRQRHVEVPVEQ